MRIHQKIEQYLNEQFLEKIAPQLKKVAKGNIVDTDLDMIATAMRKVNADFDNPKSVSTYKNGFKVVDSNGDVWYVENGKATLKE